MTHEIMLKGREEVWHSNLLIKKVKKKKKKKKRKVTTIKKRHFSQRDLKSL
jgi:hypothetical protein